MKPSARAQVRKLLSSFPVLPISEEVAWIYSRESRRLRDQGARIGDNDLWIGATAIANNVSLVSRNIKQFSRIDGLKMESY